MKKFPDKGWLDFNYCKLGRDVEDIAKECNVDKLTIYRKLNEYNLLDKRKKKNYGNIPKYQDKDWLNNQYVGQRKSTKEIAVQFNVNNSTIHR